VLGLQNGEAQLLWMGRCHRSHPSLGGGMVISVSLSMLVPVSLALAVLCILSTVANAGFITRNTALCSLKRECSVEWRHKKSLINRFVQDQDVCTPPSSEEEEAMNKFIMSLILDEKTDESRRRRLSLVFQENLVSGSNRSIIPDAEMVQQPSSHQNPDFYHFVKLFDSTLNQIGDSIQRKARENALIKRRAKLEELEVKEEDSSSSKEGFMADNSFETSLSEEERQLWCCIDMLVQSKSIVKKITANIK